MPDFRIPRDSATGISDEDLCWAVVEPLWPTAEIDLSNELEHASQANPGQRAIYTTMLYAREVDNGGVEQFLSNSSGHYSRCVLDGLELLGATEMHHAFELVMSYFVDRQAPIDWEDRRKGLRSFSEEQWASIRMHEDAVYRNGGFEKSLTPRWIQYIRQHPNEFFL